MSDPDVNWRECPICGGGRDSHNFDKHRGADENSSPKRLTGPPDQRIL